MRHRQLELPEVSLHLVEAGPESGEPIVLLHGFPEFWYGWRHQFGPLVAAGRHVIAPDQRGYNLSSKPRGIDSYRLERLAGDVVALLDGLRLQEAVVAGHDWGAAVAWWVGQHHPDRVRRLLILNVPHPEAMRRFVWRSPRQWLRGWYVLFFQLPRLPELSLSLGNWRGLQAGMVGSAPQGLFSEYELERYREAWRREGSLTAMLNWYRAALRYPASTEGSNRLSVPTDILWGEEDAFLIPELADASLKYCEQASLTRVPGCSHWIQHEQPAMVNRALLGQLKASDPGADIIC